MSDKAIYDRMSEEELAAVLRGDLQDENGLDMETLLYVMERYAHLQTVKPPKTAQEAYAAFRQNLLQSGYEPHTRDHEAECMLAIKNRKAKLRKRRAVAASAAVLALVLGFGMGVNSRHCATWKPVYRHHRNCLVITGNYCHEHTKNVPELARSWYPQWLPDGYERVRELCNDGRYMALYQRGESEKEDTLNISFDALVAGEVIRFYKNPEAAERFEHNGTVFYFYSNQERNCAVGCHNGVVISVNGKISPGEIIGIVTSMQLSP